MPDKVITICIPVYNGARFLFDAVRSALAQEYSPLEVLVVDNQSNDGTLGTLAGVEDPRLNVIALDDHVGMAENWDRTAALANGDLVLMLSADDCLLPGALSVLAAPFHQNPELDLVLGRPRHLDEAGNRPFGVALRSMPAGDITELESFVISHTPAININAILFRRGLARFRPSAGLVCDLDLLLTLGREGRKGLVVDREVLSYREHPDALSTDRVRMWRETIDCYLHHLTQSYRPHAYRWRLFKTLHWFGSHVTGTDQEGSFREKLALASPYLSGRQRMALKLGQIPLLREAASRLRNLASRLPKSDQAAEAVYPPPIKKTSSSREKLSD
ncbi:hypothetical protein NT6N_18000 [Oceaniferula spumae]|uniref:Glycosyltransferase 2-like domain-containing protein n=1 Tax=Oceaniferula spumae TaxID=2979115 RepID=A0AAT9FL70_9BACT